MEMIDLFAGIGGFSLAGHAAGIETKIFVEKDPFCRKVLKKNFPGIPVHDDIYTFNAKPYEGAIDIVSGGFPCQPFSVAGKRNGTNDDRFLWPEMYRVIREAKPTWTVIENVAGLLTMGEQTRPAILGDEKLAEWVEDSILSGILEDLKKAGYSFQTYSIPAGGAGAPHIRERIWIIGYSDHARGLRRTGEVSAKSGKRGAQKRNDLQKSGFTNQVPAANAYGAKDKRNHQKGFQHLFTGNYWTEKWISVATQFCRMDDGVSSRLDRHRRKRLKALGNSIVPQVAYNLFTSIMEIEKQAK